MAPAVVGRTAELEQVDELLRSMRSGLGMLTLAGDAGIGKTTVWREAAQRARHEGVVVLEARPSQPEGQLAFSTLTDLFDAVADSVIRRLPPPLARALAVALLREDPGEAPVDQRAVGSATLGALRAVTRERPVLIAIDDAQWIDQSSGRALDFALRRAVALPLGLLVSARTEAVGPELEWLERIGMSARSRRTVVLRAMSMGAMHEIIRQQLGLSLPRPMLAMIHEASGGNPFYGTELARQVGDAGPGATAPLRVPAGVRSVVEARMAGLGERERELLLAVATSPGATIELLARALYAQAARIAGPLDRCRVAGILVVDEGHVRFAHPIFATAVSAIADAAAQRRMHARMAAVTADAETRARHLALATVHPDRAVAAEVDSAAQLARARGAPDIASDFAIQAHRLTPRSDGDDLLRRGIDAAEYRLHAGDVAGARRMINEVLATGGHGEGRARALRVLGEIEYADTGYRAAAAAFEEAVATAGNDPAMLSALERRLAYAYVAQGRFDQIRPHAHRSLAHARRSGDPLDRAESLAVATIADLLMGQGLNRAWIDEALALEEPNRELSTEMRPSLIAGDIAVYVGELSRATRILTELHQSMYEQGFESDQVLVASHLIWAECWRGNLARAEALAADSMEAARRLGSPSVDSLAASYAALASAWSGDGATTRSRAARATALVEQTRFAVGGMWAAWAMAILALAAGDGATAARALAGLSSAVLAEGVPVEPARAPFIPEAIEAAILTGDLDGAETLLALLQQSAERVGRTWALASAARCRALLMAARGDLAEARDAASRAVEVGRGLEHRLELARSLLALGEVQRRARHRSAAASAFDEARSIFEAAGASIWVQRVDEAARRTHSMRATDDDQLTPAERRTAELAGAGLSNREIAAAMFVSPRTVEANLGRVFAKLGIRRRGQLADRLGPVAAGAGTADSLGP